MNLTRVLALTFFGFTTITTVRLAFAEWAGVGESSSEYYEHLAELDPAPARAALGHAVEANPRSSSAWIALGLAAEREGDFPEAERSLLQAARVDRQYLPAWTLASFYFRRNNAPAFWPWAQRAAALSHDDVQALLKLCDLLEPQLQPGEVLDRLGESPRLERAYLDFLIRENRLGSAQQVARRILVAHAPIDTPRLMDFTDRQLHAGHVPAALEIWNALAAARLFRFSPIGPSMPLTNGDLNSAPTGEGFDWRLPPAEGLNAEWHDSRLTFYFSGTQPETCAVLEQFLALDSRRYRLGVKYARSYRLRFEYSSAGMPSPTGMRWTLDSDEGSTLPPSETWRPAEWIFTGYPESTGRLRLVYQREPGTTRAEGRFEIRNLKLEAL